ncbi:MAG: hypothetical protein ABW001_12870 [Mycobacterium sp.]
MKKFGLAAMVASGMTAALFGVASPIMAVASAEALPVVELPGYSAGTDHHQRIDTIRADVAVPQVDGTARHQSR